MIYIYKLIDKFYIFIYIHLCEFSDLDYSSFNHVSRSNFLTTTFGCLYNVPVKKQFRYSYTEIFEPRVSES